jgi:hypothetical protein
MEYETSKRKREIKRHPPVLMIANLLEKGMVQRVEILGYYPNLGKSVHFSARDIFPTFHVTFSLFS